MRFVSPQLTIETGSRDEQLSCPCGIWRSGTAYIYCKLYLYFYIQGFEYIKPFCVVNLSSFLTHSLRASVSFVIDSSLLLLFTRRFGFASLDVCLVQLQKMIQPSICCLSVSLKIRNKTHTSV